MRIALAGAALAAFLAAPASANCIPAKLAKTFNEQGYIYISMGPGVTSAQVVGSFYALGNVNANNGTYGANEWMFVDLSGLFSMNANLGDARVNGCPAGTLITRIYTTATNPIRFLTLSAVEGASGSTSTAFDYQFGHDTGEILSAVPLPRPRVVAGGAQGLPSVPAVFAFDSTAGASPGHIEGAVTGYELVGALGSDPGRDPLGWTVIGAVPTTDGAPQTLQVNLDCSEFQDLFLATRLQFNDGRKSEVVSVPTRWVCHPALAEPRQNVIPKRPSGARKMPSRGE